MVAWTTGLRTITTSKEEVTASVEQMMTILLSHTTAKATPNVYLWGTRRRIVILIASKCMTEIKAYETLADLQGGYIPRFYGEVRLASWKDLDEEQTRRFGKYFEIRGFLMEFVDGYLLQVLLSTHQDSNGSTSWKRPFI